MKSNLIVRSIIAVLAACSLVIVADFSKDMHQILDFKIVEGQRVPDEVGQIASKIGNITAVNLRTQLTNDEINGLYQKTGTESLQELARQLSAKVRILATSYKAHIESGQQEVSLPVQPATARTMQASSQRLETKQPSLEGTSASGVGVLSTQKTTSSHKAAMVAARQAQAPVVAELQQKLAPKREQERVAPFSEEAVQTDPWAELEQLREENDRLSREMAALRLAHVQRSQQSESDISRRLQVLNEQLNDAVRKATQAEHIQGVLHAEKAALATAVEDLNSKLRANAQELEQERGHATTTRQSLESRVREHEATVRTHQENLENATQQIKELQAQVANLQQQLAVKENAVSEQTNKTEQLQAPRTGGRAPRRGLFDF